MTAPAPEMVEQSAEDDMEHLFCPKCMPDAGRGPAICGTVAWSNGRFVRPGDVIDCVVCVAIWSTPCPKCGCR